MIDDVEIRFEQGVSLDLIADWMRNSNFNVNTYAGDIRVAEDENSSDTLGQSRAPPGRPPGRADRPPALLDVLPDERERLGSSARGFADAWRTRFNRFGH